MKAFDLTVVQNSFDGERFHARYIDHVLHKSMDFTSYYPNSSATDGTSNDLPSWVSIAHRIIDYPNIIRLIKYQGRGFHFLQSAFPRFINPLARLYLFRCATIQRLDKRLQAKIALLNDYSRKKEAMQNDFITEIVRLRAVMKTQRKVILKQRARYTVALNKPLLLKKVVRRRTNKRYMRQQVKKQLSIQKRIPFSLICLLHFFV
jgi:hypothetical protein